MVFCHLMSYFLLSLVSPSQGEQDHFTRCLAYLKLYVVYLEQRGNFLKRGKETGGDKAQRKSISGKLLQDPNTASFVSQGLALK